MDRQKDWYDYYVRWCELCAHWEKIFFMDQMHGGLPMDRD